MITAWFMSIDWNGKSLSEEEIADLLKAGLRLLELGLTKGEFSGMACAGLIFDEEEFTVGESSGRRFRVDLGSYEGSPRWVAFLLPSILTKMGVPLDDIKVVEWHPLSAGARRPFKAN